VVVVAVEPLLRQRDVHARRAHRRQAPDGARELALRGAAKVHVLGELRNAQIAAVEDLEADAATARQAHRRQHQARVVDLRRRHGQRGAARLQTEGNLGRLELRCRLAAVFRR
jgi:hypothetical protein